MAYILRQIYHGRCITADTLHGRYIEADIGWQIYYGILSPNYFVKRNPRTSGTSSEPPGIPGSPRARSWDPPGTSPGPRGPPGPPMDRKTSIAQQIYSSRKFGLLHPNPFVATQHPKASPGLLYAVHGENGANFWSARPGETQAIRRWRAPHGERSLRIVPQGQAPPHIINTSLTKLCF